MSQIGILIPELLRNLNTHPATVLYPFQSVSAPVGYRGVPRFDFNLCVGCKLCVKDCTAEAIEIEQVKMPAPPPAEEGQPAPKVPKQFRMVLYLDRCIHCARCAEVCNKDAITLDREYEMANFTHEALKIVEGPADQV
jgi:formate hydrogenlyase subunit 6/NADH:ubiquinone oxidoreductase subunit I